MPAGSHQFQVGAIRCTVFSDGYGLYPTPWFFPDADREQLAQALDARRAPHETVLSPYTCLLVETGRHVVLVDTGLGGASQTSGAIVARLEMAGIRRRDVDTVVLTHAHPDHIGGAVEGKNPRRLDAMFPHARYVVSDVEWDFWTGTQPNLACLRLPDEVKVQMESIARRSLMAVRHQVEQVEGEAEIVPGLRVIPAPGHTPGHLAVLLESGGEKLLNLGDAAVHPLHLEHPEWQNGFDLLADCAVATRLRLLQRAAAENARVMAFHFPFPSVGRLQARTSGGWDWIPAT